LTAVAAFLIAAIGTVLLARSLRPLVGRYAAIEPAVLVAWTRALQSGAEARRQEAAEAVVTAGPYAVAAVLDQITAEDPNEESAPRMSLRGIRALAAAEGSRVADLGLALHSPKANVRIGAVSVLREMGANGCQALADLVAALRDENPWVRCYALEAVGNLGADAATAVPAVVGVLNHSRSDFTRRRAAEALARIGPAAEQAAADLETASSQDPVVSVQHAAFIALEQVRLPKIAVERLRQADPEVRQLCRTLWDGNDELAAAAAAKTLAGMGLRAKDGVAALALTLRHPDKSRREAAATALGKLGLAAAEFLPMLQAAAKEAEPEVRVAAEKALAEIDGGRPAP
jgi:HEAT repeat protein